MISDQYQSIYQPLGSKNHHLESQALVEGKKESTNAEKPSLHRLDHLPTPRTAEQRLKDAAQLPEILMMCGPIWLSGEVHILFADTGVGKSIMAVAIADALSRGKCFLELENECEPLRVLLYDFELSDKQVEKRYSDSFTGDCFDFSSNFFFDTIDFIQLDEINPNGNFDDLLFEKMRHDISTLDIHVLMIDNITYLNQYTTQKTEAALNLMRRLVQLKREFSLSILVLAHTPKINSYDPITLNHLAGSKQLSNFADSVSAIGRSVQHKNMRYWKQVKPSRSAELTYHADNVITCELVNMEDKFLTYQLLDLSTEREHLSKSEDDQKQNQRKQAKELHESGKTYAEIALELLGDAKLKGTIYKWVKSFEK